MSNGEPEVVGSAIGQWRFFEAEDALRDGRNHLPNLRLANTMRKHPAAVVVELSERHGLEGWHEVSTLSADQLLRCRAVLEDASAEHAKQWLMGRARPSTAKLAQRYETVEEVALFSISAHADARGVAMLEAKDLSTDDVPATSVLPHRDIAKAIRSVRNRIRVWAHRSWSCRVRFGCGSFSGLGCHRDESRT